MPQGILGDFSVFLSVFSGSVCWPGLQGVGESRKPRAGSRYTQTHSLTHYYWTDPQLYVETHTQTRITDTQRHTSQVHRASPGLTHPGTRSQAVCATSPGCTRAAGEGTQHT